jgi:uncharacterized protein (DUF2336 family)
MEDQLNTADVERLMVNPIAVIRARTAAKVAGQVADGGLSEAERALAFDILRHMAEDVSVRVREALAEGICRAPDLPRDLALKLARDVESVALPVLELATVFTEEDLVEVIGGGNEAKQLAIACRAEVPERVSAALAEAGSGAVVGALLGNGGAEIGEDGLGRILARFDTDPAIAGVMARRRSLPLAVAERLVTLVSDQLHEHLLLNHDLPLGTACDLILQARERALARIVDARDRRADRVEVTRLVGQLYGQGRLTPELVLRLLCLGDMDFFEEALAHLAVVRRENAAVLIRDDGPLGLKSLCARAGIEEPRAAVVRIAVALHRRRFERAAPNKGADGPGAASQAERLAFRGELIAELRASDLGLAPRDLEDLLAQLARAGQTEQQSPPESGGHRESGAHPGLVPLDSAV